MWKELARRTIDGQPPTRDEALSVLRSSDDDLLAVLEAAFTVRLAFWGRGVNLHVLRNAKSGICRENCAFCSQAAGAYSGVDRYGMQSVESLVEGALDAHRTGAVKYCMVTATRGPSASDLDTVCEAVRRIKTKVDISICVSLGLLTREEAERLRAAGVDRFNHNLETSSRYYPEVCQTHTWEERVETIRHVKAAGMEACCGGIVGMGETEDDRVGLAFALRELEVESIPVNFLDPRPGTPLEHLERIAPRDGLRALCMFRFVNPVRDIRVAGGREVCLRSLQPLALYPATSMFTDGYLTTGGQAVDSDRRMIEDAGFYIRSMIHEHEQDEATAASSSA